MAKGSGLSIDSDPIGFFLHKPIVLNSFQEDQYIHHKNKLSTIATSMDTTTTIRTSPPPTLQFPVNLNCTHVDDHHSDSPPPPSSPEKRTVIDEMDFFADDKNHVAKASSTADADDRKDLVGPRDIEFNVNVSDLTTHLNFSYFLFGFRQF